MEQKAKMYFFGLIILTSVLLVFMLVLQNSISLNQKLLKKNINQYNSLFSENNQLKSDWSFMLRVENFNKFTNDKMLSYSVILPKDVVYSRDLKDKVEN